MDEQEGRCVSALAQTKARSPSSFVARKEPRRAPQELKLAPEMELVVAEDLPLARFVAETTAKIP